ncbi:MAG: IS1595 family transposase [Sphingobacteriales bacterium]|nr:IS1595 family transposase [Sphingobacteriales bacterium]
MNNKYTITQFRNDFPDNDTCLHRLYELRYKNLVCPKCDSDKPFTKVKGRRVYQCPCCAYQLCPTANTVFHNSSTPLTHWFYLIFLQTTTRNGVAAKEVERQLNVCYKTALRMCHQVKKLMANMKVEKLTGIVEADESYFGMKAENMTKKKRASMIDANNTFKDNKTGVMGFVSRDGLVRTEVMFPGKSFKERVRDNVSTDATLVTDSHTGYEGLDIEFTAHETINHSAGEYKRDEWHTNTIEGFWSQLKRTIKGTHIHCDAKYLQLYADEVAFRYMNRDRQAEMFDIILRHVV